MASNRKNFFGIGLVPNTGATTNSVPGDTEYLTSDGKVHVFGASANDSVVMEALAATLTNKTLTAPVIATIVNTGTLTLPTSTDTLVGRATTDTLTNKSISGLTNTITNIQDASLSANIVTLTGTQTLTNKSISGATNTLSNISNASLIGNLVTALTGDVSATPSGPSSTVATLATVNSNVGSFGTATNVGTFTVNGKGLITAASSTSIQITESQVTNLTSDLALKAPLASPTFTGTPAAPTATAGTSTTQLATTAFVTTAVGAVGTTPIQTKSGNYTLLTTDITVIFTAAATATLPTAVSASGKRFTIINGSTTAANVVIATTSSQTIGGRASSDIILTQYWDELTVESDGANYQIITKMETTFSSTTGGKTISSASGAFQNSSPSLTLGIGKWKIRANFHYNPANSANSSIGPQSGVFAADGADNSTTPTALTGVVGNATFLTVSPNGYFPFTTVSTTNAQGVQTPFLEFIIYVTSGTKVLRPVIYINYTTPSGTLTYENYIEASRIW